MMVQIRVWLGKSCCWLNYKMYKAIKKKKIIPPSLTVSFLFVKSIAFHAHFLFSMTDLSARVLDNILLTSCLLRVFIGSR